MILHSFHPMKSTSKRSTVLLLGMTVMVIYILTYDVTYPYDITLRQEFGAEHRNPGSPPSLDQNTTQLCTLCQFYPVSGFAKDLGYKCVKTSTRPRTTTCLYSEWTDIYISHDLLYTGVWEPRVLKDFQEILGHNRNAGFIDLGANIGFYTLLAAKMGHTVLSVEPYRESIYRIHRALYLEQLGDKVFVLENAISDQRDQASLRVSGDNQGDNRVELGSRPCQGHCPSIIQTILLDDLVGAIRDNFSTAILKLDIQGFEHRAFAKASVLFEHVDISYILMEWFLMTAFYVDVNHTSSDKSMVEDMISFLLGRDYRPYCMSADGGKPLDPRLWDQWPFDIIWRRLPNAIEKRTVQSNHYRVWPAT